MPKNIPIFLILVLINLGLLEVDLLGKTDHDVLTLVLSRQLIRRPAIVLHLELVNDIRGPRDEPCDERASAGLRPLHAMLDVVCHGPILVLPRSNLSLDKAVRLRLPNQTHDERGLGFPTNCNRHLTSND